MHAAVCNPFVEVTRWSNHPADLKKVQMPTLQIGPGVEPLAFRS